MSQDQTQNQRPAEQTIRQKIQGAIAEEVKRLESMAVRADDERNVEMKCRVIEALASIKAKAELYCIQIEMATRTAAMAVANQRGVGPQGESGADSPQKLSDLVHRASRPGGASKPGSGGHSQ